MTLKKMKIIVCCISHTLCLWLNRTLIIHMHLLKTIRKVNERQREKIVKISVCFSVLCLRIELNVFWCLIFRQNSKYCNILNFFLWLTYYKPNYTNFRYHFSSKTISNSKALVVFAFYVHYLIMVNHMFFSWVLWV